MFSEINLFIIEFFYIFKKMYNFILEYYTLESVYNK